MWSVQVFRNSLLDERFSEGRQDTMPAIWYLKGITARPAPSSKPPSPTLQVSPEETHLPPVQNSLEVILSCHVLVSESEPGYTILPLESLSP